MEELFWDRRMRFFSYGKEKHQKKFHNKKKDHEEAVMMKVSPGKKNESSWEKWNAHEYWPKSTNPVLALFINRCCPILLAQWHVVTQIIEPEAISKFL